MALSMADKIRLHGMAWLALHEWVLSVLGEGHLEELDHHFDGKEFYPSAVLAIAKEKMAADYRSLQ